MENSLFLTSKPSSLIPQIIIPASNKPLQYNPRFKLYSTKPLKSQVSFSSPGTECPVPTDQQPLNEYQNLSNSFPFSWASGDLVEYSSRLFATGLSFGLLVGLPVSWFGSVGLDHDPVKLGLGSASSGLFAVTLAVLRMYLGWAYVGNRLLSATVEYEETGWYDGQVWVKTAEVLARDRLLGSFQENLDDVFGKRSQFPPNNRPYQHVMQACLPWRNVKPVLNRLKNSLVALAISLFVCVAFLINYEVSQKEFRKLANETGDRVIAGVYRDESARSFEPDAFCGEPGLVPE